jgi:hypothetical protein
MVEIDEGDDNEGRREKKCGEILQAQAILPE